MEQPKVIEAAPPRRRMADDMPVIAAWVAQMRAAFGDPTMDDAIRRGSRGETTFYAMENGLQVGTQAVPHANVWRGEGLEDRRFCSGCDGSCVGKMTGCKAVIPS